MFVLKTGAGFSLFKWMADAAADFLKQGGKAATFFTGHSDEFESWFLVGTLGAVIFFVAFVQMVRAVCLAGFERSACC
jgi:CNT family concentrative nucleoside transporter